MESLPVPLHKIKFQNPDKRPHGTPKPFETTPRHDNSLHRRIQRFFPPYLFLLLAGVCALLLFLAGVEPAWAIQRHGEPEGLYVHQMGHLLFFLAVIYLYFRLRMDPVRQGPGWRWMRLACLIFALWNVLTFTGHWLEELMPNPPFAGDGSPWNRELAQAPFGIALGFYLSKFDHLLSVPGMICVVLGLRHFLSEGR